MDAIKFLINGVYFNLPSGGSGGGGSAETRYKHFIHLTFTDGCDVEYDIDGWVVLENTSNTQFDATTFKALFNSTDIDVYGANHKIMTTLSNQCIRVGGDALMACCYRYDATSDTFNCEASYSGELTLTTITDTVISNGNSGGSGSSGGTALYNHSIKARFINNCYEEFDVIIKFQSSDNTQITTEAGFKALFSEAITTNNENDNYNYRVIPFLNSIYVVDTSYQFSSGALKQVVLGYDTINDCFTFSDDYDGPSTFVTGSTVTDTVTLV